MKLRSSLVSLALMSFVVASGQQVSTVRQTVTTIAKGQTASVLTRQVRVVKTLALATKQPKDATATRVLTPALAVGTILGKAAGAMRARPNLLPGYPNVTINSQSFGSVVVGGTPASMTLTYTFPSGATALYASFANGLDFSASNSACTSTGCSATFTFQPRYPGLAKDAIIVVDQNSNVIYETLLYGTGTAPQFGYDLGDLSVNLGLSNRPNSIAIGPEGDLYLVDGSQNAVYKFGPGFSSSERLNIVELGSPGGIAVDGDKTVYVADKTNNVILAYNEKNGAQTTVATSALSNPSGVAVNGAGLLFIADTGNGRIIAINNQGGETTLLSGINSPTSIAVDAAGDLFYVDAGNGGEVTKLPAGGDPVSIANGLGTLYDIAVDAGGRLYISTAGGDTLISPDGSIVEYGGGANYGMAVDLAGNVYTTQPASSSIAVTNRSMSNFILSTQVDTTTMGGDTISNTGNTPLMLSSIAISGTVFTNDPSSQCVAGLTVQPGQTCGTQVDFAPPAAQSYQESYTVTSNSLNVSTTTDADTLYGYGTGIPTSTALAISPNPVIAGQSIGFTGTVARQGSSSLATPTGSVNFLDGTTTLGSANLSSGGTTAQFSTSSLAAGTHSITAMYAGDTYNAPSTSAAQSLLVTAGNASATTLTSTPGSPYVKQTVTFALSVNGTTQGASVATGTVTLTDVNGGLTTVLGTLTLNGAGSASFRTTTLPAGDNSITATYNGDANYSPSTSAANVVQVFPLTTTNTSLTASPATVAYEGHVTLSANVYVQDNLGSGQVIFCETTAAFCNATQNLGVAQVTRQGNAVLRVGSGTVGTHRYTATYLGETGYSQSTSLPQTVTVTGRYPTTTAIASTGTGGSYGLTGTVIGLGTHSVGPTGTVSFLDASNANASLGSGALGQSTLGFTELQPATSPISAGRGSYGQATGDFNGDGFLDIVVENYESDSVSVLLGNGDGTFQPQVTYTVGSLPERVLVADMNEDGFLDLVVANTGSSSLSVLLGNGDGTFQTQVTYQCGSPVGLGVMDINHDGYPDVVAGDYYDNTISVLLGNGNGTLQPAMTYTTGSTPQTVAEGDFDGDGNIDVVVGNFGGATVGVFLGNGDGTFQPMVTYAVGNQPQGVQVGDFDGDGKLDLAVSNSRDNTVGVLLGNGDGTFQAQMTYPAGGVPVGLVVADFNGDGFQDISVGNTGSGVNTQSVLLGNGDGTFQPQVTFATGNDPYGDATGDFNGDGLPDIGVSNFNDGTITILLSQVTQTATASANVTVGGSASTVHNVAASYPSDTNFSASISAVTALAGGGSSTQVPSTTTLAITPAAATVGQNVAFSIAVAGATPVATGTVTLMNTAVTPAVMLGTITLGTAGTGTFNTAGLAAGTYTVIATYPGDGNYLASMSVAHSLTVSLVSQTITFGAIANQTYGAAPITLSASSSVELPISFAVTGPATVTGSTLTINGAGPVTVTASQAGNATYAAATAVSQSFTVAQAVLTATAKNASRNFGATNPALTYATSGFVYADTAAVVGGSATLSTTATATSDAGTYPVTFAMKALTATNYTFNYVGGTLTVLGGVAQTITFPTIPNHTLGDAPFALSATASSGLTVSYAVTAGPATVAGGTVTLTGAGTVSIQATQAGNLDYAAATPVSQIFTVAAVPAPTAASILPVGVVAGSAATPVTLTGANFTATDLMQAGGTTLTTTFVNATTLTATIPANLLSETGTLAISVVDSATNESSGVLNFMVAVAPVVVFTGPTTATSDQQPMVTFQLKQPYAVPIDCLLTLTFAKATSSGIDDPAVQFSTGGRTITFTVPAGSTTTPPVQFQTGTVAGTVTVTLGIVADAVNVTPANVAPIVVVLPEVVPQVATATVARTGAGSASSLTVTVTGFSNTREVKSAVFHFTPTPGSTIADPDVTVDATAIFGTWFGDVASDAFGSSFTYTQPFNLTTDPAAVESVTVTLVNGVGSSAAQTSQ